MTSPFPGYHRRPVSVDTLDGIEAVAMAVIELKAIMTELPPSYRWVASSMVADDFAEILKMIHDDERAFAAQGLRDLGEFTTRPATEEEVRQWHERR
jgi:hypothetical protein